MGCNHINSGLLSGSMKLIRAALISRTAGRVDREKAPLPSSTSSSLQQSRVSAPARGSQGSTRQPQVFQDCGSGGPGSQWLLEQTWLMSQRWRCFLIGLSKFPFLNSVSPFCLISVQTHCHFLQDTNVYLWRCALLNNVCCYFCPRLLCPLIECKVLSFSLVKCYGKVIAMQDLRMRPTISVLFHYYVILKGSWQYSTYRLDFYPCRCCYTFAWLKCNS